MAFKGVNLLAAPSAWASEAEGKNRMVVDLLLGYGADVDSRDADGRMRIRSPASAKWEGYINWYIHACIAIGDWASPSEHAAPGIMTRHPPSEHSASAIPVQLMYFCVYTKAGPTGP